jgi:hypothetical protein
MISCILVISQSQSSSQNSQVVQGDDTIGYDNNFIVQNQENMGNNAAAQSQIQSLYLFSTVFSQFDKITCILLIIL